MLADRLRLLREEKGFTQKELGEIFNLSDSRYNQYETGKRQPDLHLLIEFAKYHDVSLDYLTGVSNIRNPYIDTQAAHWKPGYDELTDEDIIKIESYIKFLISEKEKNK